MAKIILIKSLFGKSDDFPVEATFSQKLVLMKEFFKSQVHNVRILPSESSFRKRFHSFSQTTYKFN